MHRPLQLIGKRGINPALAFHPAYAFEGGRYDPDMEMGFALAAIGASGARMASVAMALIHHVQRKRRKAGVQFPADGIGDRHPANIAHTNSKSSDTFSCLLPIHSHTCAMAQQRGSRFKSDIRIKPEKAKSRAPEPRMCEAPDCIGPGNCRVPKSPQNLQEYFWYCPAHARAHNEAWDFFKGMGDGDIQRFREDALTGHRQSWPLG